MESANGSFQTGRKLSKKLAHPAILAIPSPLLGDVARARNPEFVHTQANGSEEGNGGKKRESERERDVEQGVDA